MSEEIAAVMRALKAFAIATKAPNGINLIDWFVERRHDWMRSLAEAQDGKPS